jgi:hypothetical protein
MATEKRNWLMALVIVLVLVNIATLVVLWMGKEKPAALPPMQDARSLLVKTLAMDAAQTKQFDTLRKQHFETMQADRRHMRELKDALFEKLKTPGDDGAYSTIATEIGQLQAKMDQNTFQHFKAVRALLTKDQQGRFDDVIQSVLRNMGGPPPRRMRPGDGPAPRDELPPPGEHPGPPPPGEEH